MIRNQSWYVPYLRCVLRRHVDHVELRRDSTCLHLTHEKRAVSTIGADEQCMWYRPLVLTHLVPRGRTVALTLLFFLVHVKMRVWIGAVVLSVLLLLLTVFVTPPPVPVPSGSLLLINSEADRRPSAARLSVDYEGGVRARIQLVDNGLTTFANPENWLDQ